MTSEYSNLTAEQKLRVNAHIIEFFTRGSENFIDNFQSAAKGVYKPDDAATSVYQNNDAAREAFQSVLDGLRDELASNYNELPPLRNETSGLAAMRTELRRVGDYITGELTTDLFYTAEHYANSITFFDDYPSSRPISQADLPIAFLQEVQRSSGFVSNAEEEAARLAEYRHAIAGGNYPVVGEDAAQAAQRVHTQLPDEVEAVAIQIAVDAFNMSELEAAVLTAGAYMGTRNNVNLYDPAGRDETRMVVALEEVRKFLNEIDFPVSPDHNPHQLIDTSDIVTQLTNIAQQVARNDGHER